MSRRVIAHVLPWSNIGGTEVATLRLAQALRSAGYDNRFYVPLLPGAEEVAGFACDHGFAVSRYAQVAPRKANPLPFFANCARLIAGFRREKVALVHGADIVGAYFTAWAARLSGAHATSHVRCAHPALAEVERWLLKPVERFAFVSRTTQDQQDFPCPPDRAAVLYDSAPPPPSFPVAVARSHYGLRPDAVVFGMAARLHPQKDHESLIRAAARLKASHPHLRFLMVGDHSGVHRAQFDRLDALMGETGTRDLFVFPGFEADMARFYAACDVGLLASHTEGFPLGILESMGAGLPVIASEVGGCGEAVEDGVTGFLVPDGDVAGFAAAIARLAGDGNLRRRMGEAGRQRAATRFGPERFARDACAFVARLIGPPE